MSSVVINRVTIRVSDPNNRTKGDRTFKIDRSVLQSEITDPTSKLFHLLNSKEDYFQLNYENITLDDYELCFQLIRSNEKKRRPIINKLIKLKTLKDLLLFAEKLKLIGALKIYESLSSNYLCYWEDSNLKYKEENYFLSYIPKTNIIILREKTTSVWKKLPVEYIEAWFHYIQKIMSTESEFSRNKDGSFTITSYRLKGVIHSNDISSSKYNMRLDGYTPKAEFENFYLNSNFMSEVIDEFLNKVINKMTLNGLDIQDISLEKVKLAMLKNKVNKNNITGIYSLLRDNLRFCDYVITSTIEKSIYQVIEENLYSEVDIFDTLFTLFILEISGNLSQIPFDNFSISIVGIISHFFTSKFQLKNPMNPDIVYNFLLSFTPEGSFKYQGHIYTSLPEVQRKYPKDITAMDIEDSDIAM
jgi:hypothetical protein